MSKMGSSERLPSFKGPRDLSLSSSNRGQNPQQPARPRRVYTPNIPPKRERGSAAGSSTAPVPSTSAAATAKNNAGPRGRGERGGRGRGGPMRGRGAKRPELVQEASIFSAGVGDPLEARKAYSSGARSGYDGGRYRSGGEGRSRVSNLNRTTLNTLIKQEDDMNESNAKIFGDEKYDPEEEEDTNPENPNVPVILPLLTYVPNLFAPPSPATSDTPKIKTETNSPSPDTSDPPNSSSVESISMVRIKQELPDEDDETVPTLPTTSLAQIKQEKIDEPETSADAIANQTNIFMTLPLDSTSFAGTLRSADKNGTLAYFQFPDELPVLKGSQKEMSDQPSSSTSSEAKTSAELVNDLNDLPEGFIGRFQVMSTGRTRFILGDNVFDVDPGRPVGFLQELCCVDAENKTLTNLGPVNKKFVISPDLSGLLADS